MKPLKILSYKKNSMIANTAKVYPFTIVINSAIHDFSYVSYNCTINNCVIGKFCSIAKGVKIGLGKHPINFISTSPLFYSPNNPLKTVLSKKLMFEDNKSIVIGNDVWIGANVIVLDGVTIGNGAIIGANSVVNKDVLPYSIVGGVPAKEIKKRFSDEIIEKIQNSEWWQMPFHFFKQDEVKDFFSKPVDDYSIQRVIELINIYKIKLK